ncbi:MAG: uroporphyrinogen decarboxylase family protein [Armatimonadota bacterium]
MYTRRVSAGKMGSCISSRERVLMAINHEAPDRVPADIWAEDIIWERLIHDIGVSTRDEVCRKLESDVRYISPAYPADVICGEVKQNMWGERWMISNTPWGADWQHIHGALSEAQGLDEVVSFPWPTCDDVDYSAISKQCDCADGYAIAFGNADIFERPGLVRGLENMLCDTVLNPDIVEYLTQIFLDFYIEDFHRIMEASGGRVDIYYAMTDLGTQHELLLGMDTFNRFIAPSIRALAETVHQEGVKFMFHSCGAVRGAIPALIELGVDILNPIQPAAAGMEPQALKDDFGGELCFHGGIDIQYLLPQAGRDEIQREIRRRVKILGAGGGYVLAPSHNLQFDISTENILAMYDVSLR